MAKKRLNSKSRDLLIRLVHQKVVSDETQLDKLESKLNKLFIKDVEKKYPKKDMDILLKYERAILTTSVSLLFTDPLEDTDKAVHSTYTLKEPVLLPSGGAHYAHTRGKLINNKDSALYKVFSEYRDLKDKLRKEETERRKPYFTIIEDCRYFEDVVEIWSEAEELRSQICPNKSLSVLNTNAILSIQRDTQTRLLKQAKEKRLANSST